MMSSSLALCVVPLRINIGGIQTGSNGTCTGTQPGAVLISSVSNPYLFDTDPDPAEYRSGSRVFMTKNLKN